MRDHTHSNIKATAWFDGCSVVRFSRDLTTKPATKADKSRANSSIFSIIFGLALRCHPTVPAHLDRGIFFIFASRQPHMGRSVQYILLDRPDDADRRRDHDADPPLRRPAISQCRSTILALALSAASFS